MAEFKRLSDVEVVAEPAESANVLIEENGVIKKAGKSMFSVQSDWAETNESSAAFIKNKPDIGGGGYDAVVRYDVNWGNPELLSGSYDDLIAKIKNGEWVNILIYAAAAPYNIYPAHIKHILGDWDESYYVKITFAPIENMDSEKNCFIYQNGSVL